MNLIAVTLKDIRRVGLLNLDNRSKLGTADVNMLTDRLENT